jgi:hypothetical protein
MWRRSRTFPVASAPRYFKLQEGVMMKFTVPGLVLSMLAAAALGRGDDAPQFPRPRKEHEWLQQLAGEWECEVQMFMEPGQPPAKSRGTESVRSIGGFWVVAESKGTFMDAPFTGLLTLGYDVQRQKYVGT